MSSMLTSPLHAEGATSALSQRRIMTILTAFLHMLRRDLMVTTREVMPFVMQVLVQPLCLLFVFGKVLPNIGAAQQVFPASFLPGVVALNVFLVALQGITISLMLDLSTSREIDDRLLAPLPVSLVAVEKIVFCVIRSMVAGAITFPLAYWILGNGYQVRTDAIVVLLGIMLLTAFTSAALGLVIGTILPVDRIYLLFTLIFSALLYTGCVFYPWGSIGSLPALQIATLFNPLTYASEGLRYAMVPAVHGQAFLTLPIAWILLGLSMSFVLCLVLGLRTFRRRVIA